MAKRSKFDDDSKPSIGIKEDSIVEEKPTFVEVQALFPARLLYEGEVTKTKYEWSKGGDVQLVDARDVSALLQKKVGQSGCCGSNSSGNALFVIKE